MGQPEAEIWAGVPCRQRNHASAQRTCEYVCACEPRQCHMCVCTSDFLPLPAPEEERTWLSLLVCDVGPMCGCRWWQRLGCGSLCDWLFQGTVCVCVCVCPVCVCVSMYLCVSAYVCVFLKHVHSFAARWSCKGESGSHIPQPGQRPWVPRHWTGLQRPSRRVLGWGCWRSRPCSKELLTEFRPGSSSCIKV